MNREYSEFAALAHASFPTDPIPSEFFWSESKAPLQGDIPEELQNRIACHRWPEVTLEHWLMIGAPPCVTRSYLKPSTFLYYLPSLLLGVLGDLRYVDWALEGALPYNKGHVPRGTWWAEFSATVSASQRATLQFFLALVRCTVADPNNQHLLITAESFWNLDADAR